MKNLLEKNVRVMKEVFGNGFLLGRLVLFDVRDKSPMINAGGFAYQEGDVYGFYRGENVIVIGNGDGNHVMIPEDRSLSRNHFLIKTIEGDYYLRDLESKNGTKLNGRSVCSHEFLKLENRDVISAGDSKFLVNIE